jgi:hypothetical protein
MSNIKCCVSNIGWGPAKKMRVCAWDLIAPLLPKEGWQPDAFYRDDVFKAPLLTKEGWQPDAFYRDDGVVVSCVCERQCVARLTTV